MGKDKTEKSLKQVTPKAQSKTQQQDAAQSKIWQDERFQHLVSDPRFKSLPKAQRKVKIDKRFQGMFSDEKFKVKYTVDKYGRRVNKSNAEDLKKYYELEDGSSDSEAEQEKQTAVGEEDEAVVESDEEEEEDDKHEELERRKEEKAISRDAAESDASSAGELLPGENDELDSDGEVVPKTLRQRLTDPDIDYARGEGRLITDSSSDDESSEEEDPELYIDHVWGELDVDADMTEDSTRRLAVVNMDWDRIRATDLMVLFNSFLPPGGSILSVKIYPSDFGKERLAEEERHGPSELLGLSKQAKAKQPKKETDADSDAEQSVTDDELVQEQDSDAGEGDDYHMEKLRQYQLNRLRYYYAVVECDSVHTADKIYSECDGNEYESSATRVDLRFVPDDTSFDEDEPTDVCTQLPDANVYKPRQFTTTALQQVKVDLTWDETAVERRELGDKLSSGKLDDVSDKELRKIVAYSSEEDAEDEGVEEEETQETPISKVAESNNGKAAQPKKKQKEDVISKYKALLAEISEKEQKQKKQKKYEMEFSWDVSADAAAQAKDEKDLGEEVKPKPQLTPIEKVMQKRNEKNKKRKEERKKKKLQARGIDVDALHSGSDSEDVPDGIDMNDAYFAEEFADGDFVAPKTKNQPKDKKQGKAVKEQDDEAAARQATELQLLLDDDELEQQGKQHFSLEKIQKAEQETKSKKKRRKQLLKSKTPHAEKQEVEDTFQLNVNDDRFKSLYNSHLYNIDPTDSHYKKTKAMEQIIGEKLKRRHGNAKTTAQAQEGGIDEAAEQAAKRPKKQLENALLVKSLKRKLQVNPNQSQTHNKQAQQLKQQKQRQRKSQGQT